MKLFFVPKWEQWRFEDTFLKKNKHFLEVKITINREFQNRFRGLLTSPGGNWRAYDSSQDNWRQGESVDPPSQSRWRVLDQSKMQLAGLGQVHGTDGGGWGPYM